MSRALVLSGGGARGAFQVGVLKRLLQDTSYDIVCGVSVGALNGAVVSMFPIGEEHKAIKILETLWEVKTSNIYSRWFPFGKISGLWKGSIYSTEPLRALVGKHLDVEAIRKSGKIFSAGAVCLNTGRYEVFRERQNDLLEGVLASSSFPVAFEPVYARGYHFTDGGVRDVTPINDAIKLGATHIDVVVTSPIEDAEPMDTSKLTAPKVGIRCLEIMLDEVYKNDLKMVDMYNELMKLGSDKAKGKAHIEVRLFAPIYQHVPDSLVFDPEKSKLAIDHGVFVASNKLNGFPI